MARATVEKARKENKQLQRRVKETFQALQGAHAVAEQTKRAAQEAVRAARREQVAAERARAEAEAEAASAAEAAAAAETAAAEAREGFPELARERAELAERLAEADRRSDALRRELLVSDERGAAHRLALEAAQRRVAKEADRADTATAVAARRAGELLEAREEAERLRDVLRLGGASNTSHGERREAFQKSPSLGNEKARAAERGDEAAAADAAAARARRSAAAASEAASLAKRASRGDGDTAVSPYARGGALEPSPFAPRGGSLSRPGSPAGSASGSLARRRGHFSDGFSDNLDGFSDVMSVSASGAGSARETTRDEHKHENENENDAFSFPGESLPSPPRQSSWSRRGSGGSRDEFKTTFERVGGLASATGSRRGSVDGEARLSDFAASRSALDAEMENATALLDALREGRVAPSLDGSDVSLTGSRSRSGSPARRRHRRDSRALYASEDEGSFRSYQYQYE